MKKLILIGAGGHAKSVADSINKSEYLEGRYGVLLYTKIYSHKYIELQNFNDEEMKEYNKIEDIKFNWELWEIGGS